MCGGRSKVESGAKSAFDSNEPVTIKPYIADDVPAIPLSATGVTTVVAERSFWDKVIIVHGTRHWFEGAASCASKASGCLATTTISTG